MKQLTIRSGILLLLPALALTGMTGCSGGSDDDDGEEANGTNTTMSAEAPTTGESDDSITSSTADSTSNSGQEEASDLATQERQDPASDANTQSNQSQQVTTTAPPQTTTTASGVPDFDGNWSGVFYNTKDQIRSPINAVVRTMGRAITIQTNSSHFFTGEINGQNGMSLIDAADGQDWTTKFGAADSTQIRIADVILELRDPVTGQDFFNVIELYR